MTPLEAIKALVRHSEGTNAAFYGKGTSKAMRAAMEGQRDILQGARAAIAEIEQAAAMLECRCGTCYVCRAKAILEAGADDSRAAIAKAEGGAS